MSAKTKRQHKKRQVSISDDMTNVTSEVNKSADSIALQLAKLQAEEAAKEREFKIIEAEKQREFEMHKLMEIEKQREIGHEFELEKLKLETEREKI